MNRWLLALFASLAACDRPSELDRYAGEYVALARALDLLDPGFLDTDFGGAGEPVELTKEAIETRARALRDALASRPEPRARAMRARIEAALVRLGALSGQRLAFDEESNVLLGVAAPPVAEAELAPTLDALDALLPGEGPLVERYARYREALVVPDDRTEVVLKRALEECRRRTLEHIELPPGERVLLQLVSETPWAAYHLYKGDYESVVQVNVGAPLFVDRVVEEVCHESYPGHHVQRVLAERALSRDRGWVESSVVDAYGFDAFLAEGAAVYGVELAFPDGERIAFERDVLFPLAGLPVNEAVRNDEVRRLVRALAPAVAHGVRRHLDGELDLYSTILWLEKHALVPRARGLLELAWRERTRVLGYTLGESMARRYLESSGSPWSALEAMWTSPNFPEEP